MKQSLLRVIGFTTLAAGFLIGGFSDASAERIKWKMASAYAGNSYPHGTFSKRIAELVNTMSGGEFDIKWFEPGALVPPLQSLDAVGQGSIESAVTSPGFHTSKLPVAPLFSSIPFGPDAIEQFAWIKYGGGQDIYNDYLSEYGAKSIMCGYIGAQGAGWFRKPIKTLDDLKGLKMRFFGYGARVMEKLGVSTQLLAGGDIYPALELGTIDATEYGVPTQDQGAGFYQVAKHYYFPSWHEPYSLWEVIVNIKEFDALPKKYQVMLETVCDNNILNMVAESNTKQPEALAFFQSKGVTLETIPTSILEAMRGAWTDVIAEQSAADPKFKRAWDSLSKFRSSYEEYTGRAYKGL